MASPKVFVSSTCYDLGMAREQIRSFLIGLGYDPIMSEYSDVLYDPRQHTHTSCLQEIPNADMVVLLVGSRFGGTAIPEALKHIDIDKLVNSSFDVTVLDSAEKMSVTQLEVLKAVESSIPVFTMVDQKVMHDHMVYQKNKDLADTINFPSIDKPESAKYIFEFINFLRQRTEGNGIVSFSNIEEIETHLRKQWAALFQRLLQEQRNGRTEEKRVTALSEQLEELKTAVLSTMENSRTRDIARNVIKYRRLSDFLRGLRFHNPETITNGTMSFEDLLTELDIVSITKIPDGYRRGPGRTALLKSDKTFYELRFREEFLSRISMDWTTFSALTPEDRSVIFDALSDMDGIGMGILRYRDVPFDEYFEEKDSEDEESINDFLKKLAEESEDDTANKSIQSTAEAAAD
jgi:hypothetical protein